MRTIRKPWQEKHVKKNTIRKPIRRTIRRPIRRTLIKTRYEDHAKKHDKKHTIRTTIRNTYDWVWTRPTYGEQLYTFRIFDRNIYDYYDDFIDDYDCIDSQ